jgi:hypothetical protein
MIPRLCIHVSLLRHDKESVDEAYEWLYDMDLFGSNKYGRTPGNDSRLKSVYSSKDVISYTVTNDVGLSGPYAGYPSSPTKWHGNSELSMKFVNFDNLGDFRNYVDVAKKEIHKKRLELLRDKGAE